MNGIVGESRDARRRAPVNRLYLFPITGTSPGIRHVTPQRRQGQARSGRRGKRRGVRHDALLQVRSRNRNRFRNRRPTTTPAPSRVTVPATVPARATVPVPATVPPAPIPAPMQARIPTCSPPSSSATPSSNARSTSRRSRRNAGAARLYFRQTYDVDPAEDDWDKAHDGEVPCRWLASRAIDELRRRHAAYLIGVDLGQVADDSYAGTSRAWRP